MARQNAAAVFVLLAAFALASACGPDRFTDSGCEVDDDCRGERMCVEGLCVGEGSVPDGGSDAGEDTREDPDVVVGDDGGTLDIGSEEDAGETDLEAFTGQWELEGPITVLDEDGNTIQEVDPQLFLTRIGTDGAADLDIRVGDIDTCPMTADVTGPNRFEIRASECSSNPIDEVEGVTSITGGSGRLFEEGPELGLEFTMEIAETQFGTIQLLWDLRGPRTEF